jgi:hypothetical protein
MKNLKCFILGDTKIKLKYILLKYANVYLVTKFR